MVLNNSVVCIIQGEKQIFGKFLNPRKAFYYAPIFLVHEIFEIDGATPLCQNLIEVTVFLIVHGFYYLGGELPLR
jgi:hypothetical protein